MRQIPLSAVIMARDEEANIEAAIASLSFASQIVVADTGSRDNTMDLAGKSGAEVHSIKFDGYGASKNRAISFAKHDWILCVDADERVSPELAESIVNAISNESRLNGYAVNRLAYFLGRPIKHSGWYPDYVVRLFKKGKGRFSERLVHESIEIEGGSARLNGLLYHHSYPDLDSYFEKMNVYSSMSAIEMFNAGRKIGVISLLIRPFAIFLKMYFLKLGILDGYHGLLLAILSSFHVFVKYAKLRELHRRSR